MNSLRSRQLSLLNLSMRFKYTSNIPYSIVIVIRDKKRNGLYQIFFIEFGRLFAEPLCPLFVDIKSLTYMIINSILPWKLLED